MVVCGGVHTTAYSKPIDCKFAPFPAGVDCLLKEGPLMYDGQSVFVAASADISASATVGRDADRRASYAFSTVLAAGSRAPLVLGWVMGDDENEARRRIARYMSPAAAAAALAARTSAANEFLSTKVPQLNVTLKPLTASSSSHGGSGGSQSSGASTRQAEAAVAATPRQLSAQEDGGSRGPSSPCTDTLASLCGGGGAAGGHTVQRCDECVGSRQAALRRAGCTGAEVQEWCSHAPHRAGGGPSWDEHRSAVCHNSNAHKIGFLHNATTLEACEVACGAEAECRQLEFKHASPQWCALYNTSSAPSKTLPDSPYDCACKGACPQTPSPGPSPGPNPHKPPKPSPIPPMNRTLDFNNAYYFGWAMYWLMLLESDHPPYETVGHAQSAPNNFLGLHLHDSQYYLRMGSWVEPELHPRYAHGNVLLWHSAAHSPMYSNASSSYWQARRARGMLPDNMGATWIASSTCNQLADMVQDSWVIYERSGVQPPNATFLAMAYDLFNTVLRPSDGNITGTAQRQPWRSGKHINALLFLSKMAAALGKHQDAADWVQLLNSTRPWFRKNWGQCGERLGCAEGIVGFSDAMA
jgi:hypothetical protein